MTIALSAFLLAGGDGVTVDSRSFFAADVSSSTGDLIESLALVVSPGTVGYASNGFRADRWAGLGPAATPTATPGAVDTRSPVDTRDLASRADVVALVSAYSWPVGWALAVIECESGGDWYTWDTETGVTYFGGLQIAVSHGYDLSTIEKQLEAGYDIFLREGPGAWPSCP